MEGGKPEDVSLLAGGADQPLIPVQGGGGGGALAAKRNLGIIIMRKILSFYSRAHLKIQR